MTTPSLTLTSLLLLFALSACSVHKIDVQQGNVITQEMMEKLTVGMEKRQVMLLLGSPLIEDPFHSGRWDYVYSYMSGDGSAQQYAHVVLSFENDKVAKIDVLATPPRDADIMKPALSGR